MNLLPGESVLVADPDLDAGLLYACALKIPESQVTHATNGRDALAKALACRFSLVITETVLPFIDGFALCEILRRDQATRSVPILVVTADARVEALTRAVQAGADGVIVKPFEPTSVLAEAERLSKRADPSLAAQSRFLWGGAGKRARADAVPQQARDIRQRGTRRQHHRFATSHPPIPPPVMRCPTCDASLSYVSSQIGGVSEAFLEQWDFYACHGSCRGSFEYRHRTRRLRAV